MADMRGIIERATETGEAQSTDPKIRELLRKVRAEAEASVPYTMDDVNNLEESIRARGGDPSDLTSIVAGESIRDFAGNVFRGFKGEGGAGAAPPLPPGIPEGSTRTDQTSKGRPVWRAPDGSLHVPD
jgi:hypothetical protein